MCSPEQRGKMWVTGWIRPFLSHNCACEVLTAIIFHFSIFLSVFSVEASLCSHSQHSQFQAAGSKPGLLLKFLKMKIRNLLFLLKCHVHNAQAFSFSPLLVYHPMLKHLSECDPILYPRWSCMDLSHLLKKNVMPACWWEIALINSINSFTELSEIIALSYILHTFVSWPYEWA